MTEDPNNSSKFDPAVQFGHAWEVEVSNDPRGIQNTGFRKRGFATVATTSNLNQFTKYSHLQWSLL